MLVPSADHPAAPRRQLYHTEPKESNLSLISRHFHSPVPALSSLRSNRSPSPSTPPALTPLPNTCRWRPAGALENKRNPRKKKIRTLPQDFLRPARCRCHQVFSTSSRNCHKCTVSGPQHLPRTQHVSDKLQRARSGNLCTLGCVRQCNGAWSEMERWGKKRGKARYLVLLTETVVGIIRPEVTDR